MSWWCCIILSTIYRLHSQSNPWTKHIKRFRTVFQRHSLNRHGFKTMVPSSVFSACRGSWAGLPWATDYLPSYMTSSHPSSWEPRVSVLQDQNDITIFEKTSGTMLFWMAKSHSTSTTSWALLIPNSRSLIHIAYDSSNPDYQYRSQNTFTSATGAKRLRGSFNLILPKVSCLFPFLKSLSIILKVFL